MNRACSRRCQSFLAVTLAIFAAAPSAMAQQSKAAPPNLVRLYVFDCGSLTFPIHRPIN